MLHYITINNVSDLSITLGLNVSNLTVITTSHPTRQSCNLIVFARITKVAMGTGSGKLLSLLEPLVATPLSTKCQVLTLNFS